MTSKILRDRILRELFEKRLDPLSSTLDQNELSARLDSPWPRLSPEVEYLMGQDLIEMKDLRRGNLILRLFKITANGIDLIEAADAEPQDNSLDIFISHSHEDADTARRLIEILRCALDLDQEKIRCTSVDGYRLPSGTDTEDRLGKEIPAVKFFVALVSLKSIRSTYVKFEIGARWGAGRQIAPLLLPGVEPSMLSGPLDVSALRCDSSGQMTQFVEDLAKALERPLAPGDAYRRYISRLVDSLEPADNESR